MAAEPTNNSNNVIGSGTTFTGALKAAGNVRFDGELDGSLECQSKIVLGAHAVVKGDLIAQNAEIEGKVKGTVQIAEVLILKASARIEGDIVTKKIIIESGAQFNGKCQMGEGAKKRNEPRKPQNEEISTPS
ncbi:MAG: polymer-forming cytoskeletal protein [Cytophagales bacterium]|nr:polymer-forming cytoskeletal protein [Cytophagales bacterium]